MLLLFCNVYDFFFSPEKIDLFHEKANENQNITTYFLCIYLSEKFLSDLVFRKYQNVDFYINFVQDLGSITKYQA